MDNTTDDQEDDSMYSDETVEFIRHYLSQTGLAFRNSSAKTEPVDEKNIGYINVEYENGKTTLIAPSKDGVESKMKIGSDLLKLGKTYSSLKIVDVSIKWNQKSGRNGYRSIFNTLYFLPRTLTCHRNMEQGSMRFTCKNLKVYSDACDEGSVSELLAALYAFKVTDRLEIEGRLNCFKDLLNIPLFYLHDGKWLSAENFLRIKSEVAIIVLNESENSWNINDLIMNAFLRRWVEGKKTIRYLEIGSNRIRPRDVVPFKMSLLTNKLDPKPTKFGLKTFVVPEFERSVECQGGWDIKSKSGEVGTILRKQGKMTFVVWPREN